MKDQYGFFIFGKKLGSAFISFLLFIVVITFIAGCKTGNTPPPGQHLSKHEKGAAIPSTPSLANSAASVPLGHPTISYIGQKPVIGVTPGETVDIQIHGTDLYQDALAWSVEVGGTRPAKAGRDYVLKTYGSNPDDPSVSLGNAVIELLPIYTAQLHDKDTIDIEANIVQVDAEKIRKTKQEVSELEASITNAIAEPDTGKFNSFLSDVKVHSLFLANTPIFTSNRFLAASNSLNSVNALTPPSDAGAVSKAHEDLKMLLQQLDDIQDALGAEATRFPSITSGSGHFAVYTVDSYRQKFQESDFELFEIRAFPMPESMATDILGSYVAQHYYVVALSLQNSSSQDRIFNSGLINVWGKLLVYPEGNNEQPAFSKPITVSPDSLQQVYAAIANHKVWSGREWFFRTLEFGGSLSTAIATGFKGSPDLIKALGVYTGVGIPGLQKLIPDQVPNYLANVVNFGMPELVKVPHGASQGYQLLFFSKDSLAAMIPDPSQFGRPPVSGPGDASAEPPSPKTFIIYLSFDTMVVPYQLATESTSANKLSITTNPSSVTANADTNVAFSVTATGTGALAYQWVDNNISIQEDANHIGTKTATLTINDLQPSDNGAYKVTITDSTGASISTPEATLKVNPWVNIDKVNPTVNAGATLTLTAIPHGLASPSFAWQYKGKPLSDGGVYKGSGSSSLTITKISADQGGAYSVTASDSADKSSASDSTTVTVGN